MLSQRELRLMELTVEELGARIREQRHRLGLTQEQLAEKAQVSKETIGRLEQAAGSPAFITICRVANALGSTGSALISGRASDEVAALVNGLPKHEQQIACVMIRALSAHVKTQ